MIKKEIIDLAKEYSTDLNGKTILNCGFTRGDMSLRIDYDDSTAMDSYVCARIDGKEWCFKHFRQACVFHFIVSQIGSQEDETLEWHYEIVKKKIGAISNQEADYLQTKIPGELIPEEDN